MAGINSKKPGKELREASRKLLQEYAIRRKAFAAVVDAYRAACDGDMVAANEYLDSVPDIERYRNDFAHDTRMIQRAYRQSTASQYAIDGILETGGVPFEPAVKNTRAYHALAHTTSDSVLEDMALGLDDTSMRDDATEVEGALNGLRDFVAGLGRYLEGTENQRIYPTEAPEPQKS